MRGRQRLLSDGAEADAADARGGPEGDLSEIQCNVFTGKCGDSFFPIFIITCIFSSLRDGYGFLTGFGGGTVSAWESPMYSLA